MKNVLLPFQISKTINLLFMMYFRLIIPIVNINNLLQFDLTQKVYKF